MNLLREVRMWSFKIPGTCIEPVAVPGTSTSTGIRSISTGRTVYGESRTRIK